MSVSSIFKQISIKLKKVSGIILWLIAYENSDIKQTELRVVKKVYNHSLIDR